MPANSREREVEPKRGNFSRLWHPEFVLVGAIFLGFAVGTPWSYYSSLLIHPHGPWVMDMSHESWRHHTRILGLEQNDTKQ